MENQTIPSQSIGKKLNRRYWDVAFTYWLMFGAIVPAIVLHLFIFAVGSILMISRVEISSFAETILYLILKPIAIWLVIQFIASSFYIGKQKFLENKSKIINSATVLVVILNLLLIAYGQIGGIVLNVLLLKIIDLFLSVLTFYFASKKYLPSANSIENTLNENKKLWDGNRRKIIFAIVILIITCASLSFLKISKATTELPNMQKVAEQFIIDIQNKNITSANDLLVDEIKKSDSKNFLTLILFQIDSLGGIKEYEITSQGIQLSGLRIYGNFNGEISYKEGPNLPFLISITKKNGQYRISNVVFAKNTPVYD